MTGLTAGTHIKVSRSFYSHHGIYIGEGKVIHYSGLTNGLNKGRIKLTSLNNFLGDKSDWEIVHYSSHERRYTNSEIVKRAYSRLDENEYNIIFNNCEHFACWCITGKQCSKQVNDATMYFYLTSAPKASAVEAVIGMYAYHKYSSANQSATTAATTSAPVIIAGAAVGLGVAAIISFFSDD